MERHDELTPLKLTAEASADDLHFKMLVAHAVQLLVHACYGNAKRAGWWNDLETGTSLEDTRNVGETLMLIVSELAEAMEGHRKTINDDHLPNRPMFEVELADALIRICDLAGAKKIDLAGAVAEKLLYNQNRPDHKPESRRKANGKKY